MLIKAKEKVASYPFEGYWLDMGRPDDYATAIEEFESRRGEFLPGRRPDAMDRPALRPRSGR